MKATQRRLVSIEIENEEGKRWKAHIDETTEFTIEDALYTLFNIEPLKPYWWEELDNFGFTDFRGDSSEDIYDVSWNGMMGLVVVMPKE